MTRVDLQQSDFVRKQPNASDDGLRVQHLTVYVVNDSAWGSGFNMVVGSVICSGLVLPAYLKVSPSITQGAKKINNLMTTVNVMGHCIERVG